MTDEELIARLWDLCGPVDYNPLAAEAADRIEALVKERDEAKRLMGMRHQEMLAADGLMRKHQARAERLVAEVERLRGALVTAREWVFGCTRTGINQDLAEADLATITAALKGSDHEH